MKSFNKFFQQQKPCSINTEKHYTNFQEDKRLLTCPAVYLKGDCVKKGLENSFTGHFKVLEQFDKYSLIKTSKGNS